MTYYYDDIIIDVINIIMLMCYCRRSNVMLLCNGSACCSKCRHQYYVAWRNVGAARAY